MNRHHDGTDTGKQGDGTDNDMYRKCKRVDHRVQNIKNHLFFPPDGFFQFSYVVILLTTYRPNIEHESEEILKRLIRQV